MVKTISPDGERPSAIASGIQRTADLLFDSPFRRKSAAKYARSVVWLF